MKKILLSLFFFSCSLIHCSEFEEWELVLYSEFSLFQEKDTLLVNKKYTELNITELEKRIEQAKKDLAKAETEITKLETLEKTMTQAYTKDKKALLANPLRKLTLRLQELDREERRNKNNPAHLQDVRNRRDLVIYALAKLKKK